MSRGSASLAFCPPRDGKPLVLSRVCQGLLYLETHWGWRRHVGVTAEAGSPAGRPRGRDEKGQWVERGMDGGSDERWSDPASTLKMQPKG